MSSNDSSAQVSALSALSSDQADNVSWEDRRFSVHVNDTSFDLGALPLFPWDLHSELVIRISPAFDSPDPKAPHMVDIEHGELYMRALVERAKRAAANWKDLLQDRINKGECQIELVFGEC
ncbi:hypothetical protein A1O1_06019 [Capronia coronata CBS 617.96]|uniref:Uncharacterized protein n=1 Tax=Capronia coronata CBS 617.96 TaxID=1182541 RepID=W9XZI5_9EURO|nr:uncharacterized protein A1O1_06019 [Capronia coronata CBS 617.96]EXJ85653.1 hypothetical protein A1O1_06019 [Capronia coronata CBS 617.96]